MQAWFPVRGKNSGGRQPWALQWPQGWWSHQQASLHWRGLSHRATVSRTGDSERQAGARQGEDAATSRHCHSLWLRSSQWHVKKLPGQIVLLRRRKKEMACTSPLGHCYISEQCLELRQPSCYQPESKANTQSRTQPAGRKPCHPTMPQMESSIIRNNQVCPRSLPHKRFSDKGVGTEAAELTTGRAHGDGGGGLRWKAAYGPDAGRHACRGDQDTCPWLREVEGETKDLQEMEEKRLPGRNRGGLKGQGVEMQEGLRFLSLVMSASVTLEKGGSRAWWVGSQLAEA